MTKLISRSNTKIVKGEKYGWRTFGLHLAPTDLSGHDVCPNASKGCKESCLNTAGYGQYDIVQQARIKKTKWFFENRESFMAQLYKEVRNKVRTAKRRGEKICFRLNLTSDIAWESIKYQGKSLMQHFPTTQFYDYTKNDKRMMRYIMGELPKNYHLTFSKAENNDNAVAIVLGCGANVAVVFKDKLPKTYMGKKVIDATKHDLRFKDPKNVVAGLVALGKAKKDTSGFVVETKTNKKYETNRSLAY
jgi:hypothetical protein